MIPSSRCQKNRNRLEEPKHDNSQSGHGFHRERHAFFFRRYEGEKKEESPEADVEGDPRVQGFFEETFPGKKSRAFN